MKFEEFYTYCNLTGIVAERKSIDVTPFGVQYRIILTGEGFHSSVFYREINNNLIMVANGTRIRGRVEKELSTEALFNLIHLGE